MIKASVELAEAIGFSYKSLKHSVDLGRFSPRMAQALETHLGLQRGILKLNSEMHSRRMNREHREAFVSLIGSYVRDQGIEKTSRLMEVHYEVARKIVSGTLLPSLLSIRALHRNTGDRRFLLWDDPSYVYSEESSDLGSRIRNRRVELGLTQRTLGQLLGNVTHHEVCRYEKGRRDIPEEKILLLAEILQDPELIRIKHAGQETTDDSRSEEHADAA